MVQHETIPMQTISRLNYLIRIPLLKACFLWPNPFKRHNKNMFAINNGRELCVILLDIDV